MAGLEYDTDYNIRVRARYSDGDHADSPWNGPWTETTAQVKLPLPAAPFIGAIAVSPDGEVLLSWFSLDEDDSITGYQILRGPDADNLTIIEDDTGSSSTSYTDETPPAGQTHTYGVKARNASGLSPLSNTLTATVPAAEEEEEELVTAQQNQELFLVSNLDSIARVQGSSRPTKFPVTMRRYRADLQRRQQRGRNATAQFDFDGITVTFGLTGFTYTGNLAASHSCRHR